MSEKGLKCNLQKASKDFCEDSSFPAVQHLSGNEKSTTRVLFWSIIAIVTLLGSVFHIYSLVSAYLEYDYYELITHDSEEGLQLPHVTICDPYPMSVFMINKYIEENMQTFSKLIHASMKVNEYVKENKNIDIDIAVFIARLLSMEAIYANLPAERKHISSLSIQELLVECYYGDRPCGYENFTQYIHPEYGSCYTFNMSNFDPKSGNIVGPDNGLSLILKSQTFNEVDPMYLLSTNLGNSVGLFIDIHQPGTMPNIIDTGFVIEPGRSTSVGLKQKVYKRIKTPKMTCQNEEWFRTTSGNFTKSFTTCDKMCKLRSILNQCSCVSTKIPAFLETDNHCLKVNLTNIQHTIERARCEMNVFGSSDTGLKQCKKSCLWPCYHIEYEKSQFSSKWPNYGAVQDFINKFVLTLDDSNPIKTNYDYLRVHYMEINNTGLISTNNTLGVSTFFASAMDMIFKNKYSSVVINQLESNQPLALEISPLFMNLSNVKQAQEHWVNKGFYRLNIYWKEASVEVHRQVLSYNSADLGSGLGGILGLWAGISLISCVEFIVFIGTICKVVCQYCSKLLGKKQTTCSPVCLLSHSLVQYRHTT